MSYSSGQRTMLIFLVLVLCVRGVFPCPLLVATRVARFDAAFACARAGFVAQASALLSLAFTVGSVRMRKEQAFRRRHAPAQFSSVVVAKHKTQSAGSRKTPDSDSDTDTDSDDDGCVGCHPPPPSRHATAAAALQPRLSPTDDSPTHGCPRPHQPTSPPQAPERHVALPTPGAAGSQPVFYQQASAPPPPAPDRAAPRSVPGSAAPAAAPVVPPPERPVHDETTRALFAHMWQSMKEVYATRRGVRCAVLAPPRCCAVARRAHGAVTQRRIVWACLWVCTAATLRAVCRACLDCQSWWNICVRTASCRS